MTLHLGADRSRARSRLYAWIAVTACIIVLVGFSRTCFMLAQTDAWMRFATWATQ